MPDPSTLALFVAAALALLAVPGPAVLYIVSQSIDHGRGAGLVSVLGVGAGSAVQVAAASLGLSSLLLSSATAFSAVKYAGAAYLLFLGLRTLLAGRATIEAQVRRSSARRRLFFQGALVNVTNPKTALFFFAFLPQFVDASAGSATLQIAFLGGLFVCLGLVSDGLYAVTAGTLAVRLRGSARLLRARRYLSGSVLVGLGVAAALSGSRRSL
jgi:threonine/homoserine/homoserine lactone efflux protein